MLRFLSFTDMLKALANNAREITATLIVTQRNDNLMIMDIYYVGNSEENTKICQIVKFIGPKLLPPGPSQRYQGQWRRYKVGKRKEKKSTK